MTAILERPIESVMPQPAIAPWQPELATLQPMLTAQAQTLARHTRMLETLDARREQLDDLVGDLMPIVNAALLMMTRSLGAAATPEVRARLSAAVADLVSVSEAPAPGTVRLLKRLRDPDVRKGLALVIAALGAAGHATSTEPRVGNDTTRRMT